MLPLGILELFLYRIVFKLPIFLLNQETNFTSSRRLSAYFTVRVPKWRDTSFALKECLTCNLYLYRIAPTDDSRLFSLEFTVRPAVPYRRRLYQEVIYFISTTSVWRCYFVYLFYKVKCADYIYYKSLNYSSEVRLEFIRQLKF